MLLLSIKFFFSVRINQSFLLVFSTYQILWDRVGSNFNGRVPGYSRQWAIIGDATNISTFTNLKLTQIMGSNHLPYLLSATVLFNK